jgi:nicotinate-nucleotide pyrophosphorylase (carboxylating)
MSSQAESEAERDTSPGDAVPLLEILIEDVVRRALAEDLGQAGDITTRSVITPSARTRAVIVARGEGILAGAQAATLAFTLVDSGLTVRFTVHDGSTVARGDVVAKVEGAARSVLTAERTALNFLGHLSGVATATHKLVQAVEGTNAKICCTRKTTPGLRALEKYAVRAGGGVNHRLGLDGAILIKDNHIAVAGGVSQALAAAQASAGPLTPIEIEVDTLDQLDEAIDGGASVILLDNMPPSVLSEAVEKVDGRAHLEASGNVTVDTVRGIAETGVDYISSGWITHSAPILDFGLDLSG